MRGPSHLKVGIATCLLLVLALAGGVAAAGDKMPKLDFDPYDALGVPRSASKAAIRRAFRKLSLELHPDKNPGNEKAQARFTRVSKAYEVLGDSDKRAIYDEFGQEQYTTRWEYMRKTGGRTRAGDFYGPDTNVLPVTQRNFTTWRTQYMLVEFYAPWCVHCQQMAGEYRRAALLLDGVATVGAVNCERQKTLCRRTNIRSYPALFLYGKGDPHSSPDAFHGEHTADAIADFVEQIVNPRTVELTGDNFQAQVMDSNDMWLVAFTTPWCGPCRATKPALRQLAFNMHQQLKVGLVDCERSGDFCQSRGVRYFPYLVLFPHDNKASFENGNGRSIDYQGAGGPMGAVSIMQQVLEVALEGRVVADSDGDGNAESEDEMEDFYRELDAEGEDEL